MSLRYRNSQGIETPVAGLNGTSGELVPSVALQQSGTVTFSCAANSWTTVDVTFATPMPDTDYLVNTDSGETAYVHVQNATIKQTTGFTMIVWNRDAVSNTGVIRWTAFKLMTDTVHEADAAHIAQNTANFAPAFSEVTSYDIGDYVTYNNVLYRCTTAHTAGVWVAGHFTAVTVGGDLSNLSAVVPSNASSSNKLVTREDITPSDTQYTVHKNYTNIASTSLFDSEGALTKTPTELINALKAKGYLEATVGYQQLHCVINFVNSNTNRVTISDGTHSINLVNGWLEFEGAFTSDTSTFGVEERWIMRLYDVESCKMALVTKRAGTSLAPIMKTVTLS